MIVPSSRPNLQRLETSQAHTRNRINEIPTVNPKSRYNVRVEYLLHGGNVTYRKRMFETTRASVNGMFSHGSHQALDVNLPEKYQVGSC